MSSVKWRVDNISIDRSFEFSPERIICPNKITATLSGRINGTVQYEGIYKSLQAKLDGDGNIKKVIFNNPATIILWNDGTKTVVKVQDGEKYDKERGFLMCYLKGIVGNKTLLKELDKWVGE